MLDALYRFFDLSADVFGTATAVLALFVYARERKKFPVLYQALVSRYRAERLHAISTLVEEAQKIDYSDAPQRKTLMNTLGRLVGALKTEKLISDNCKEQIEEIERIINRTGKLTEPIKQRLLQEIRTKIRDVQDHHESESAGVQS